MKKFFACLCVYAHRQVGFVVLALSVAGILGADLSRRSSAEAEQKFFIPIGENFKYHVRFFKILINMRYENLLTLVTEGKKYALTGSYNPSEGTVQEAAEKLLRQLAGQFSLSKLENTNDTFSLWVLAYPDPPGSRWRVAANEDFGEIEHNFVQDTTGYWRIPEKALTLKMRYEWASRYYLPWVRKIETVLRFKDGSERREVINDGEDISTSPSILAAYVSTSEDGTVALSNHLIVPSERIADDYWATAGWEFGEMIFFGENGAFVTVNLQNGAKIAESNPPPYPTGRRKPRLARITRIGDLLTVLALEGEKDTRLIVEFCENLANPQWENVLDNLNNHHWGNWEHPYVLLTSNAAIIIHHTGSATTGFFRVRE